jgi:hypothetical protein
LKYAKRSATAFLIILCLFAQACESNKIREAAKASDRMATLIGSAIDLKRDLAAQGAITPQEELTLTTQLLTVNTQVKTFNNYARTLKEDTPETRLNLANAFNQVTQAINGLSNQAIFPIKNAESKQKFLAILNSINASISIVNLALEGN